MDSSFFIEFRIRRDELLCVPLQSLRVLKDRDGFSGGTVGWRLVFGFPRSTFLK